MRCDKQANQKQTMRNQTYIEDGNCFNQTHQLNSI